MAGRRAGALVAYALLAIGSLAMIFPFLWMLISAFKDIREILGLNFLPQTWTLSNFEQVVFGTRFPRWFLNSLLVAALTTLSVLFFCSLVGYTLTRLRFPGRRAIFLVILSTLMIPTEMLVIPWYVMAKNFGWLDSYWGIMFPGMMTAFGTFLMKQFFETVPNDFLEAARVDGLNEFAIFWRIALPLVTPALSALAIFTFLSNWTAFIWPLIVTTSKELYTLPVGLTSYAVEAQVQWELIMTGAALATLPTLTVFLLLQRYIVRGVVLAGLKG
jgi:multiple sugar transport system permease protein